MDEISRAFWDALEALGKRDGFPRAVPRGQVFCKQMDFEAKEREPRYISPQNLDDIFTLQFNTTDRIITLTLVMPAEVISSMKPIKRPRADFESTAEEITNHAGKLTRPVKELEP